jgi:mercuric ion binding protein
MRQWMFVMGVILWLGMAHATTPTTVLLHAANMTCPTCSVTIEKALSRVPGVTRTEIDLKTATVTVTFDADRTSVPMLARTITDAGFPAVVAARGG